MMMEVDNVTLSNPKIDTDNNTNIQENVKMGNYIDDGDSLDDEEDDDESSPSNRLDQIISNYRLVQESATNEINRKRQAVRSKCEERLWMAALWRDYQLEIVKKSFDNEIKQIEKEHQSEFNNLKDALIQELQEERKKLQILEQASFSNLSVDKTGNLVASTASTSSEISSDAMTAALLAAEEQAAVASGRRLRRREDKGENVPGLPTNISSSTGTSGINGVGSASLTVTTTTASRRKQINNIYTYNTMLPEQEILDDLGAIAKEAGSLGTSRRAAAIIKNTSSSTTTNNSNSSPSVNVSFDKGVLHYNWDIIGTSDRIKIQLSPNTPALTATVLSCSPTELVISTGPSRNQTKINLNDLKSGKITILTEDQLLHDS